MTLASTVFGYLGRGGEKVSSQSKLVGFSLISRVFGFFVLPHFFNVLVLLPQALQLGGHLRLSVLFVGLHLVGQLLFRHLTEVVVLLYRLLKHFFLVLPFLSKLLQDLSFMGLASFLCSF